MAEKKILVTGAAGMLGTEVIRLLERRNVTTLATVWPETENRAYIPLDITDEQAVEACIAEHRPTAVINCAAYTNVDKAEEEKEIAAAINGTAVGNLARACLHHDCLLAHVSTDYVFNGNAATPYRPDSPVDPQSAYGRGKLLGEQMIQSIMPPHGKWFIVRTSWLFGPAGKNFIDTILRVARERGALKVVNDQFGCPTSAVDLARCLVDLAEKNARGIFHFCNPPVCSWHEFAYQAIRLTGIACRLEACRTNEFPRPAPRPAYSVLNCDKTFDTLGWSARPWRAALNDYLQADHVSSA